MITPNASQDYFVIYHYDNSDGHWMNIKREYLTHDLSDEEFADKFVNLLREYYPNAISFDVWFRDVEGEEFFKKYEV